MHHQKPGPVRVRPIVDELKPPVRDEGAREWRAVFIEQPLCRPALEACPRIVCVASAVAFGQPNSLAAGAAKLDFEVLDARMNERQTSPLEAEVCVHLRRQPADLHGKKLLNVFAVVVQKVNDFPPFADKGLRPRFVVGYAKAKRQNQDEQPFRVNPFQTKQMHAQSNNQKRAKA